MLSLLLWIISFAAFMYLVTPILIRFSQKYNSHPKFQPVALATLPPPAAQYLWTCQQALESEGFTTVAHLAWENSAPNVFPLLTLYMNRQTGVKAITAAFYVVSAQGAKLTTCYTEFITRYEDGLVLQTSNNGTFGTSQHGPKQKTLRLPEMQNPHELYAIHRRMAGIATAIEPLPPPGMEISAQEQRIVEDFNEQVGFGRLSLDTAAGVYRPTWKGAYLMTWSQLWPMKNIRKSQERTKSRIILKELEASSSH